MKQNLGYVKPCSNLPKEFYQVAAHQFSISSFSTQHYYKMKQNLGYVEPYSNRWFPGNF